jgi:hypothetical protein
MWRRFRATGFNIVSSWIDEAGPGETASMTELWSRVEREVRSATRLVLYVEPHDFPLKGALIEVGMALGAGVPVYVVAPDVAIDPRSLRPIGSWLAHPLVTLTSSIDDAFTAQRVVPDFPVRTYTIRICDLCIRLEGAMCHNPECVFCRRTVEEVRPILADLMIRDDAYGLTAVGAIEAAGVCR